jgi:hypothetical protein
MGSYLPLAYLLVTIVGGCMALANIAPVPVRPHQLTMERRVTVGAFGARLPRVTTPPGPQLYRTMPAHYEPLTDPTAYVPGVRCNAPRLRLARPFVAPTPPNQRTAVA